MINNIDSKLNEITQKISDLKHHQNLDVFKDKLKKLQKESSKAEFWNNKEKAQNIMKEIGNIEEEINNFNQMEIKLNYIKELTALKDGSIKEELDNEISILQKNLDKFELEKYLNGKYDKLNAIISIHSGQGGTEANDWTAMLLRMYTKYCESQHWEVNLIDVVHGQETGYSSVSIEIKGKNAFGYLKREHGTHRLVRISPFNAQNKRQTSFAGVEVLPIIDSDINIETKPEDIEFSAVRSSGKGGQNVNKVSTSVRIKHVPTGIIVSCSSERSQNQNRENALKLLKGKLYKIEEKKHQEELSNIKGTHRIASWGNQVRNYILQPYKLVKDLRTDFESVDPDRTLDGDLQDFINAQLKIT